MTNKTRFFSRRSFLQTLAAAATVPALQSAATAQDKPSAPAPKKEGSHRILCANILLASPAHDGTPHAWSARKELCLDIMKAQQADIICTQEVLRVQAVDMAAAMPSFQSFGFPGPFMDQHPDGYHGVTKNVILFNKDKYEMTSAGGFWLSETPLIAGSVSWDALRGRHANWVRLKDRETGKQFRVIDTHFDHKGKLGRVEQAKIINSEAGQYAPDFPQILAGDFNADVSNPAVQTLVDAGWKDSYAAIHGPEDPGRTFHALKGAAYETKSKTGKIDFVFCKGPIKPVAAAIVRTEVNGNYPSDHYFVTADILL